MVISVTYTYTVYCQHPVIINKLLISQLWKYPLDSHDNVFSVNCVIWKIKIAVMWPARLWWLWVIIRICHIEDREHVMEKIIRFLQCVKFYVHFNLILIAIINRSFHYRHYKGLETPRALVICPHSHNYGGKFAARADCPASVLCSLQ